ncbi:rifin, partial [Plasmodium reichenowi]
VAAKVLAAGIEKGIQAAIQGFKVRLNLETISGVSLNTILNANNVKNPMKLSLLVHEKYNTVCWPDPSSASDAICLYTKGTPAQTYKVLSEIAKNVANDAGNASTAASEAEAATYTSTTSSLSTGITASIIAILVIVLIMVIIYLILRYRRKKKMKKKVQYIKLLEE